MRIAQRRMRFLIADPLDGMAKKRERIQRKPIIRKARQPRLFAEFARHRGQVERLDALADIRAANVGRGLDADAGYKSAVLQRELEDGPELIHIHGTDD